MQKNAIFHIPYDNYAYLLDENQVEIRIQTGKDVEEVILHYNDPYSWDENGWIRNECTMDFYGEGEYHYYFKTTIETTTHRLKYFFELKNEQETCFYGESGIQTNEIMDVHAPFFLPYLHKNLQLANVDWVKKAQWYQIFPDRFHKGTNQVAKKEYHAWDDQEVSNEYHYGGNLAGIRDQISYIKDLGINAIYLTPIFQANTSHKYDTSDYLQIDFDFGDEEDFKSLIEVAHQHEIKVILDAVFNHSGDSFAQWQDVLKNGKNSKYFDWFHVVEQDGELQYEKFAHCDNMPKLNTQNEEVANYLINAALHWTKLAPIDGWRLDVANEIDHVFWRRFRTAIKDVNPHAYILGEVWHDAKPWLRGDEFDGVMNYPLTYLINKTLQTKDFDFYRKRLIDLQFRYPSVILPMQFNLLDSHDTARIYTQLKDINLLKIAYLLLFSNYGTPCIFYGSEILLEGENDPYCRQLMKFDHLSEQQLEFKAWMTKLQHIRQLDPTFGNEGSLAFINDEHLLVYEKRSSESNLRFYINLSEEIQTIQACGLDLFQNKIIHNEYELQPYQFLVLKTK